MRRSITLPYEVPIMGVIVLQHCRYETPQSDVRLGGIRTARLQTGLAIDWLWDGHGRPWVRHGLGVGHGGWSWVGHGLVMGWSWVGHGLGWSWSDETRCAMGWGSGLGVGRGMAIWVGYGLVMGWGHGWPWGCNVWPWVGHGMAMWVGHGLAMGHGLVMGWPWVGHRLVTVGHGCAMGWGLAMGWP